MLSGLFGKKKIQKEKVVQIYVDTIFDVIERGFPEIVEFINNEKQFTKSPQLGKEDFEWFTYIIYGANVLNLYEHMDTETADDLKLLIIREVAERYTKRDQVVAEEIILEYEGFLRDLYGKTKNIVKTISLALFNKFELNNYQDEHYQRLNAPNPVFLKDLNEMMELFVWNWEDFFTKYKIAK
ncbi:MAG: hypothetical protein MH137_13915 [Flavobacteriales bacterium]|nr:hypothetical protein [Flavobacteriales bacterium]